MNDSTSPLPTRRPQRLLFLIGLAAVIAVLATLAGHALHFLISLLTNLAFFGRFSHEGITAVGHLRGAWVILIPALGGGLIALMARYGSPAIIGHGIPEVMQQVLVNRSRITPLVAFLKPLSSVISIGTGAPYGAEGPVIATGSAVGSLLGQFLTVTASERKILLSVGAAAAMTAIFGSPVAATLLAVELLLFEFSARSVIPVAAGAALAQALRLAWGEPAALFPLAWPPAPLAPASLITFIVIGLVAGVMAVSANRAVHLAEAGFAKLPVHWMWRPVIGGLLVGMIGWWEPRVFGPGYGLINGLLAEQLTLAAVAMVCGLKLLAWIISLGSGTSGGTLAPMLIAGGGMGVLAGAACHGLSLGEVAPGLAALAGMVAFFASGSRAFFASIILGVELTQQAGVLWPVTTAAVVAMAMAHLLSRRSIMSSPVEQRGIRVPMAYDVDIFSHVTVGQVMERHPRTIDGAMLIGELADRIGANDIEVCHHPALLVTEAGGALEGLITRRDLLAAVEAGRSMEPVSAAMSQALICAYPDEVLHDAVERMHHYDIGRLPVVERANPRQLLGYLGRGAVLSARRLRWQEENQRETGWLAGVISQGK